MTKIFSKVYEKIVHKSCKFAEKLLPLRPELVSLLKKSAIVCVRIKRNMVSPGN